MRLIFLLSFAAFPSAASSYEVAPGQFMQGQAKQSLLQVESTPKDEEKLIQSSIDRFKKDKDKEKDKEKEKASDDKHVYDGTPAQFTAETMPKVSPAVQCVINLSIQYFVVYTLLAFMRTFNQFTGNSLLGMQKILETACTTVTYAPMLAVLFLGIRMRAIQLTQGETEKYGLPQPWVQQAMYVATFAVLAQVIMVVLMPIFTGEWQVKVDEEG